ncbi:MAG: PadR family transcriptional regulator [Chloroflexi bacterium]|nr:PadR family transcriptional regulator [Chloroflexota bacterium]
MALKYALLGFIRYAPMTGYDLKKYMELSTRYFWTAELAQIYPTLKQLEDAGWIESEIEPQVGKPDKKIYTITKAGKKAQQEWLKQPLDFLPTVKEPVLLQLFFSGVLDKETILAQLRLQLQVHRDQVKVHQTEIKDAIQEITLFTKLQRDGVMWELVREFGEGYEKQYVKWLEHAIKIVEEKL